jgi:hypothetical protein
MGIRLNKDDEDGDALECRWVDMFRKAWRREVRRKGTAFVPCDAFDAAMKAALLAIGEFWPETVEPKKVRPCGSTQRERRAQ